jgi:hypothetical protein
VSTASVLGYLSEGQPVSGCCVAELRYQSCWGLIDFLDLEDLRASSAKLHNLPPPNLDLDAWVDFAVKSPKSWTRFVRALDTSDAPDLPETLLVTCSICGVLVAKQGLRAHCARVHSMFRLARAFVGSDGVCPVCSGNFMVRLRCVRHIH